jgi:2-oxoglutarate dehydrogenase E1 component
MGRGPARRVLWDAGVSTTDQTVQVVLPELGESVTEGVVVEWRKAVGEAVSEGETLLDVTTDKVDVEIPAPAAGVLLSIAAGPGAAVEVGALLGEIGPGGGAPPAPAPAAGNGAAGNGAPAAPAAPPATGGALVAIQLPDMESVTEGTVVEWRKQVGQAVAADEIVVEVSTDKVDLEVPSPAAGVLESTAFTAGETFPVAEALGQIRAGATASADGAPAAAAPAAPAAAAAPSAPVRDVPATPVARRLAHEAGVDLLEVTGTGPGGLIRKGDVREAIANPKPAAPPAPAGEEAVTLRGPAAALAEYMDESRSIPTATTFRTLPVAILDAERKRLNGALAAGGGGKLSFTHLIAWAIVQAVGRTPSMGTGFQRVDGTPQKLVRDAVHLGIAVDVERKDGSRSLLVPVIREADRLGFAGFRAAFDDLIERSRTGKIKPDELRGASVTLTNPGGFGTVASVPRLMNGQGTIVATGSIGYPPGLDSVPEGLLREWGVTKVMTMTSTYDHRVIQGAESGAFLRDIAMLLQGQDGFYDEVRASLGLGAEAPLAQPQPTTTPAATPAPAPVVADEEMLRTVAAAVSLVRAYRTHGHLAARLDPLGSAPEGDPALDPSWVGLTHDALAKVPASILDVDLPQVTTAADALTRLREVYCGAIAYEFAHISDHEQRAWLRQEIESGHIREPLPPERKRALLERLISVETFERFLRRTYLGQKTFSLEGCDVLVPVLDESLELLADGGAQEVIIGMAHRGRLAAMTHTVNRPFESILAEFEGVVETGPQDESGEDPYAAAGDVKYHLGAEGTYVSRGGRPVQVTLAANPSHLEQVDAVAEGRTRARQTLRTGRQAHHDPTRAVAVLVHGDAAFPGQGVVAETLNLQALTGYTTGGTIHVIANNQVGFTTDPEDSRSTRYASDLAKGFDMPIVHVNADDVEANIAAVRLSAAFRRRFGQDVLIDIIGYRRLGHNELDEPAYTQPVMARTIKNHPTVARVYATQLISEGVIDEAGFNAMVEAAEQRMGAAHKAVVSGLEQGSDQDGAAVKRRRSRSRQVRTHVSEGTLRSLNEQLHTVPDGVTIHPKLLPQLERRRQGLDQEQGITWAHAESLAFASLLIEGVPVRLTGQDVARGTFSQRHLELHDIAEGESYKARKGRTHIPMQTLLRAKASFEIHNSPLSESATVGFEYGYSTQAPETLVIWEAQYGDFANGAQIMIDQFIAAGEAKWGVQSRLTLLLPHGYEGNGPEHSSARVERFLRLGAEDNIRIANCSTAANYFHLLRRQGLSDELRPLVVFTPKSLLRAKSASSTLADLAHGTFQPLLEDPRAAGRREEIRRMILCTGKIFHELDAHPDREAQTDLAVTRVEGLYPFPKEEFLELLEHYPNLEAVTWAQEEPRNMGAWSFVTRRVTGLLPRGMVLGYIGRPVRASPSEGYPQTHQVEQQRVLREALVGIVMAGSW